MAKFNVGDKVRCEDYRGETLTIEFMQTDIRGENYYCLEGKNYYFVEDSLEKINDSPEVIKDGNKKMTLKEKFILAIASEPQKSFRKAGITNGDDLLTDEGEKIFLSWLLSKNADAFKTEVVDELLKEKEDK
jgi:hypothetical protein